MVCGIINECGEQMFMDDGLLHWATSLTHDFIRKEWHRKACIPRGKQANQKSCGNF